MPPLPKDKRDSERNLFGTEFPWAQGELTAEGKTYKKIGIRYAGEISYFASSQGLKRPLKIDFDKFGEQQFHGLTSLQLHAMPMDPAKGREVLAYSVFRAAGVPAPRTAFAEVTLTVPGKYDKEYLGLYAVVESVDKPPTKDSSARAGISSEQEQAHDRQEPPGDGTPHGDRLASRLRRISSGLMGTIRPSVSITSRCDPNRPGS